MRPPFLGPPLVPSRMTRPAAIRASPSATSAIGSYHGNRCPDLPLPVPTQTRSPYPLGVVWKVIELSIGDYLLIYGRRKVFCIESVLHTPCIPVSMLALGFTAGGAMSLRVEDGVSERIQHWNGDTKGHSITYAEYLPPMVITLRASLCCNGRPWQLFLMHT